MTQYVIKDQSVPASPWYLEKRLEGGIADRWSRDPYDAKRFNSATEASLYAVEHNITGVEIVAV